MIFRRKTWSAMTGPGSQNVSVRTLPCLPVDEDWIWSCSDSNLLTEQSECFSDCMLSELDTINLGVTAYGLS
jgi:hypothetical protein